MNIDRRQLALQALALGILGAAPAYAGSPDEDAVAKNVEAFRLAQIALDAKAHIAGAKGRRVVPVADFCTGPGKNVLAAGELLTTRIEGIGERVIGLLPRTDDDVIGFKEEVLSVHRIMKARIVDLPVNASRKCLHAATLELYTMYPSCRLA